MQRCGLPGKGCLCDHPGPRLLLGQGQQNLLFTGVGLEGRVKGAVGISVCKESEGAEEGTHLKPNSQNIPSLSASYFSDSGTLFFCLSNLCDGLARPTRKPKKTKDALIGQKFAGSGPNRNGLIQRQEQSTILAENVTH